LLDRSGTTHAVDDAADAVHLGRRAISEVLTPKHHVRDERRLACTTADEAISVKLLRKRAKLVVLEETRQDVTGEARLRNTRGRKGMAGALALEARNERPPAECTGSAMTIDEPSTDQRMVSLVSGAVTRLKSFVRNGAPGAAARPSRLREHCQVLAQHRHVECPRAPLLAICWHRPARQRQRRGAEALTARDAGDR
jgi:hypothetical protein